jgi:hypothetical protein
MGNIVDKTNVNRKPMDAPHGGAKSGEKSER